MGNIYGYVRVSSIDQNEDRQLVVMNENSVPIKNVRILSDHSIRNSSRN